MHPAPTATAVPLPDAPPAWAARALEVPAEHGDTDVAGTRVHWRAWGPASGEGVVLVHGGAAHSGWWDHVGPLLAEGRRVVALDLSGHGDSDHRAEPEDYSASRWAAEVVAVADEHGLSRPHVVGHSMGGWVAVTAAAEHADRVAGIVVIDSPLLEAPPEEARLRHRRQPTRVYEDRERALGRFSTIPPQDVVLPWVARHVAEQSLRPVEGGWTWKFDPAMFGQRPPLRASLPRVTCDALLLRCEHGLLTPAMAEEMTALAGGRARVAELPDTGHHPMLDQPLVLVSLLRTVLALAA